MSNIVCHSLVCGRLRTFGKLSRLESKNLSDPQSKLPSIKKDFAILVENTQHQIRNEAFIENSLSSDYREI